MKKMTVFIFLCAQVLGFHALAEDAPAAADHGQAHEQSEAHKIHLEHSKKRKAHSRIQRARREIMKERSSDR